ncbi:hypothetical protein K8R47_02590 [archaeon]|nr:hypothetical protein [archaeon]
MKRNYRIPTEYMTGNIHAIAVKPNSLERQLMFIDSVETSLISGFEYLKSYISDFGSTIYSTTITYLNPIMIYAMGGKGSKGESDMGLKGKRENAKGKGSGKRKRKDKDKEREQKRQIKETQMKKPSGRSKYAQSAKRSGGNWNNIPELEVPEEDSLLIPRPRVLLDDDRW